MHRTAPLPPNQHLPGPQSDHRLGTGSPEDRLRDTEHRRSVYHQPAFLYPAAKIPAPLHLGASGASASTATDNATRRFSAAIAGSRQPLQRLSSPQALLPLSPVTEPSPSTVDASPRYPPGPLAANGGAEATGKRKHDATKGRSSIACDKCRRSKTRCENTGINTTCKSCANSSRPCVYGPSSTLGSSASLRHESLALIGDFPAKKRRKPLAPISSSIFYPKHGLGTLENALDSPLLTPKVWEELFHIYQKHFAIDFPFFHKQTFLNSVHQHYADPKSNKGADSPQATPHEYHAPLLLAFLTQTARHHEELVKHTISQNPIVTAEFYARATLRAMGPDCLGTPTVEKIQALLMLGYHEYTSGQGTVGWVKIGIAIRCAQVLGYQWDADYDDLKAKAAKRNNNQSSEKSQFIVREIQRRTLWSCCLMDRYMSWGRRRPSMIRLEELQDIQLVCSDQAFVYGRKVRTRLLGEDDTEYERRRRRLRERLMANFGEHREMNAHPEEMKWEVGDSESDLSWYIQIVDHFGEISKWSSAGGRLTEGTTAPWDPSTTFYRLEEKLKRLKAGLPDHLKLTRENTEAQIYHESGKYVLIHTVYTMCVVWLYREYMAMAPWNLAYPKGPMDDPLIMENPPRPTYWVDQAKDCFGACREFADLLYAVHSSSLHNKLVETPTVAFAAFTVAWSAIYCHYFPKMDPDGALGRGREPTANDVTRDFLVRMSARYKMAGNWCIHLSRVQIWLAGESKRYKSVGGVVGGSPHSSSSDSGGGLKDYAAHFVISHKTFGQIRPNDYDHEGDKWDQDKDIDVANTKLPPKDDSEEPNTPFLKAEDGDALLQSPPSATLKSFTAINSSLEASLTSSNLQLNSQTRMSVNRSSVSNSSFSNNAGEMSKDLPAMSSNRSIYSGNIYEPIYPAAPEYSHSYVPGMNPPTWVEEYSPNSWPPIGMTDEAAKLSIEKYGNQGYHNYQFFNAPMVGDEMAINDPVDMPTNLSLNNGPSPINTSLQRGYYPTNYMHNSGSY